LRNGENTNAAERKKKMFAAVVYSKVTFSTHSLPSLTYWPQITFQPDIEF
jgi:hypothetical protein